MWTKEAEGNGERAHLTDGRRMKYMVREQVVIKWKHVSRHGSCSKLKIIDEQRQPQRSNDVYVSDCKEAAPHRERHALEGCS